MAKDMYSIKRKGIMYQENDDHKAAKKIKELEKWCKEHNYRYSYIHHDQDIYTLQDEAMNPEHKADTPKAKHWHMVIDFRPDEYSIRDLVRITKIGQKNKDNPTGYNGMWNILGKTGGRYEYALENAEAYLTHSTTVSEMEGKTKYPNSCVKSSYDYDKFLTDYKKKSEKIKAQQEKKEAKDEHNKKLDNFLNLIMNNQVPKDLEWIMYKSMVSESPSRHSKDMVHIRQAYKDRKAILQLQREDTQGIQGIYISGEGGAGKSTIAEIYCSLLNGNEPRYTLESGRGMWEGYQDQKLAIWNDFGDDQLKYKTFLANLEPHGNGSKDARNRGIDTPNLQYLIITADKDIWQIYDNAISYDNRHQIYRRFQTMIKMDTDTIETYVYDKTKKNYSLIKTEENPIKYIKWKDDDTKIGIISTVIQGQELLKEAVKARNEYQGAIDLSREVLNQKTTTTIEDVKQMIENGDLRTLRKPEKEFRIM